MLLGLLFLLPWPSLAAAQVEIELSVAKKEVVVGESFEVVLSLKRLGQGNEINLGAIPIPGIDSFQQFGSSQSTNMSIVNGNSAIVYELRKTLAAKNEGEYRIGPVKLQGTDGAGQVFDFVSNEIIMTVKKASIFSNGEKETAQRTSESGQKGIDRGLLNVLAALIGLGLILYMRGGRFRDYLDEKILRKKEPGSESEQLTKTETARLPDADEPDFYPKIAALVRAHLIRREKGMSEVMTTSELLAQLRESKYYRASEATEVLQACDANRYAHAEGDRARIIELADKILRT